MYEKDDYLLVNSEGEVVAVSGNSDFDDIEITDTVQTVLDGNHNIVLVLL